MIVLVSPMKSGLLSIKIDNKSHYICVLSQAASRSMARGFFVS